MPVKRNKIDRHLLKLKLCIMVIVALTIGSQNVFGSKLSIQRLGAESKGYCDGPYDCIGVVIDSGDPILIQMGHEMSNMVTDKDAGTMVKPTAGPIANVRTMLSRENAGLSVVPSDMLKYLERSEEPVMRRAKHYLRFIMTIGRKVVHVIARKSIHRLEDLNGKRVVTGPDHTAMWVVSNNLLYLHGVIPSKRLQLKPIEGITSVLLDRADAVFIIGNVPIPLIERISMMHQTEAFRQYAEQIHMLALNVPQTFTEYQSEIVHYPGFAENLETVAIFPTLVSYDFSLKSTPYFRRRCRQLARIGSLVRNRLHELREIGHKQWQETSWELEAGNWEKDPCFFGTTKTVGGGRGSSSSAPERGAQLYENIQKRY